MCMYVRFQSSACEQAAPLIYHDTLKQMFMLRYRLGIYVI